MAYKHTDETQRDEHAVIGGVAMKKVAIMDNAGNQIIDFGGSSDVAINSNITLDPGSKTGIVGNVTISDSKGFIGLTTVAGVNPGTGASDLGKAEDSVHTSGDVGVMALGVRADLTTEFSEEGDYSPFAVSEHGCILVDPQHYASLDDCDSTDGWSVINNDTDNLTTSTNHVWKTNSLSFDKVDGAGNTVFAGIQKTLPSTNLNGFMEEGGGFFLGSIYVTSIADIDYVWFRVGTDSSNYNEWRVDSTSLTANQWNALRGVMRAPYVSVGDGWSSSAVTYMAIGAAFNTETDTLAGMLVDGLFANSGLQTSADITSQISTSVSSPNVKITGWLGSVDTGTGNVSSIGTLRVTNATNDVNLSAIKTAVETIDNVVSGTNANVAVKGNVTLSDSKGFIGLTTTTLGTSPAYVGLVTVANTVTTALSGNVTISDSKGFIGLVTVGNTVATSFSGNVTLDAGSKTQVVGNVTLSDPKGFIGLVTAVGEFSTSFSGNVTLDAGSKTQIAGNVTLSDSKGFIGLVTAVGEFSTSFSGNVTLDDGSLTGIVGNVTLSDSKSFIGLTTTTLGASPAYVGIVTVANASIPVSFSGNVTLDDGSLTGIVGNVTLSDPKTFIGLTTTTLGASPAFVGIVTVANASIPVTFAGNVTLDDGSLTGIVGNVTLSDPKTFIGLTTTTLGASPAFVGIVTIANTNIRALAGNVTLDAGSKTQIIGNVTISDSKGFIGLVTAVNIIGGTNKTLIPKPVTLGNNSLSTVAVPTDANKIYITNLILNSNITTEIAIKSGVTYLTGNASLALTIFPGGGFVFPGTTDSPSWIGCGSGALVFEKRDPAGTISNVAGSVIYYDSA